MSPRHGRSFKAAALAAAAAAATLLAAAAAAPTAAAAADARPPLRVLAIGDSLSVGSVPTLWQNRPYSIEMGRRLEAIFLKAEELAGGDVAAAAANNTAGAPSATASLVQDTDDELAAAAGPALGMTMNATAAAEAAANNSTTPHSPGRAVVTDAWSVIGGAGVFAPGPYERKQTLTEVAMEALQRGYNGTGELSFCFWGGARSVRLRVIAIACPPAHAP
jgi:hypothetical protein